MRVLSRLGRSPLLLSALLILAAGGGAVWLAGCAANDPFDPASLENIKPVVRLAMTPVDTAQVLSPTSYFNRTFNWSGSDPDGWVAEFHVSVRNDSQVPAPWAVTSRTDTTMTFETDGNGDAEATFLLACRDNRGAMSDTLVQFIPLKNFPPAVNFQSDFDPLRNMQREYRTATGEVTEVPSEADTTLYWNWGPSQFRLFALDLDGQETMDGFYRYTLMDVSEGDPETTFLDTDPAADPSLGWVQVPFDGLDEVKTFEILIYDAPVGPSTTLTVSVRDEALADTRFQYSWEVREPAGPILYVADSAGPLTKTFYRDFLSGEYGEGNFAEYEFWFGFPDDDFVLLQSMRKFQAVMWAGGGAVTPNLKEAANTGGVITRYVKPDDGATPGRFLLVAKDVVGVNSNLPFPFLRTVLGVSPTASPVSALTMQMGRQALGLQPGLPAMTAANSASGGMGLLPSINTGDLDGESLYQMEYCQRCYSVRPPYDPLVAMRWPERASQAEASTVTIALQLEYFVQEEAWAVLSAILNDEMGVSAP